MEEVTEYWATYGRTESGDYLKVLLFSEKPDEIKIEEVYKNLYPYEYESVGFVNWTLDIATVFE